MLKLFLYRMELLGSGIWSKDIFQQPPKLSTGIIHKSLANSICLEPQLLDCPLQQSSNWVLDLASVVAWTPLRTRCFIPVSSPFTNFGTITRPGIARCLSYNIDMQHIPIDRSVQIPARLHPYFQEYEPAQLDLTQNADLVIQRVLEFGTWDEWDPLAVWSLWRQKNPSLCAATWRALVETSFV